MNYGQVAKRARENKERHPEKYCPVNGCLWCVLRSGPCPKHAARPEVRPIPHASDCAVWVGENCDCVTGKEAR